MERGQKALEAARQALESSPEEEARKARDEAFEKKLHERAMEILDQPDAAGIGSLLPKARAIREQADSLLRKIKSHPTSAEQRASAQKQTIPMTSTPAKAEVAQGNSAQVASLAKHGGRPRNDDERKRVHELRAAGKSWAAVRVIMNQETGQQKNAEAYRALTRPRHTPSPSAR